MTGQAGPDRTGQRGDSFSDLCVAGVPAVLRHGQLPRLLDRHEPLQVLPWNLHGAADACPRETNGREPGTLPPQLLVTSPPPRKHSKSSPPLPFLYLPSSRPHSLPSPSPTPCPVPRPRLAGPLPQLLAVVAPGGSFASPPSGAPGNHRRTHLFFNLVVFDRQTTVRRSNHFAAGTLAG